MICEALEMLVLMSSSSRSSIGLDSLPLARCPTYLEGKVWCGLNDLGNDLPGSLSLEALFVSAPFTFTDRHHVSLSNIGLD